MLHGIVARKALLDARLPAFRGLVFCNRAGIRHRPLHHLIVEEGAAHAHHHTLGAGCQQDRLLAGHRPRQPHHEPLGIVAKFSQVRHVHHEDTGVRIDAAVAQKLAVGEADHRLLLGLLHSHLPPSHDHLGKDERQFFRIGRVAIGCGALVGVDKPVGHLEGRLPGRSHGQLGVVHEILRRLDECPHRDHARHQPGQHRPGHGWNEKQRVGGLDRHRLPRRRVQIRLDDRLADRPAIEVDAQRSPPQIGRPHHPCQPSPLCGQAGRAHHHSRQQASKNAKHQDQNSVSSPNKHSCRYHVRSQGEIVF